MAYVQDKGILIDTCPRIQMETILSGSKSKTKTETIRVRFKGSRKRLKTCPVAVRAISIWEEIIRFEGPGLLVAVLGSHIASGRRVEEIQPPVRVVGVVDQLVNVLVLCIRIRELQHR